MVSDEDLKRLQEATEEIKRVREERAKEEYQRAQRLKAQIQGVTFQSDLFAPLSSIATTGSGGGSTFKIPDATTSGTVSFYLEPKPLGVAELASDKGQQEIKEAQQEYSGVTRTRKYECPHCGEIFDQDDFESLIVYYHGETSENLDQECSDHFYTLGIGEQEEAWKCANGCFVHDYVDDWDGDSNARPNAKDWWSCDECGTEWDNRNEALECYKDCKEDED